MAFFRYRNVRTMPKVELRRAQIHLTNRCNLNCKYCEVPRKFVHTKDLADDKWIEIVNDLCEMKAREITISGGGEPTLRFDLLIDILKITRKNDIKTGVITNGTLLRNDFARKVVEVQPDEWRTSICAPEKNIDAFLRGEDLSEISFNGIRYISEWKKKLNSELPKLEIWMVQTKYNIQSIEKMIQKASEIGANSISLRMVNPPNSWLYPSEEQRKTFVKNLDNYKKIAIELGLELRIHFTLDDILPHNIIENIYEIEGSNNTKFSSKIKLENRVKKDKIVCMFPFHELVIFADGRVSPCCNFIAHDETSKAVENITDKNLKKIWFGKKFEQFRKNMVENNPPARCRECTPDFQCVNREYKRS